jgi:4-amino-4-deoxy-L-arabinose transferase-like glycosyltransferase
LLRLPAALVTALCIALALPLLWRLSGGRVALLAGVLWATDPFLVAHSQLLHVDALLTSLMMLSLLAAMVACLPLPHPDHAAPRPPVRWWMVGASAVAGGLALLTKSPSVLLLPMVALVLLLGTGSLWKTLQILLLWGFVALGVWVALWPLAWVDLPAAVLRVWNEVVQNGAPPHGGGNFFLGRPVDDPGPLFYPTALVLRLTPWTFAGLFAAAGAAYYARHARHTCRQGKTPDLSSSRSTLTRSLLILYVLLLLVALSIPSKKFDRYFLPAFPALVIIAASGWVWLCERIWGRLIPTFPAVACPLGLSLLAAGTTAWYHPYELAYYNPLVGGGSLAAQTILVGWGEGLEQVGTSLASRSDGCDRTVLAWRAKKLGYFICNPVLASLDDTPDPLTVAYAVLYVNVAQRNAHYPTIRPVWETMQPIRTIRIHGIDYAAIYQMPSATFGETIRLRRSNLDATTARTQGFLRWTAQWECLSTPAACRTAHLTLRVFNPAGQTVSQTTAPLLPPEHPWPPGEMMTTAVYTVPLAVAHPPGTYRVGLSLFHSLSSDGGSAGEAGEGREDRVPLRLDNPFHHPDISDEGTTLLLKAVSLPLEPFFGPSIHLRGYEVDASAEGREPPENTLLLHLRWSATAPITTDYTLFIHVLKGAGERVAQGDVPPAGSNSPTGSWQVGQEHAYTHTIPLPPDLPPGDYRIALGLYDPRTLERLPVRGAPPTPDGEGVGPNALLLHVKVGDF